MEIISKMLDGGMYRSEATNGTEQLVNLMKRYIVALNIEIDRILLICSISGISIEFINRYNKAIELIDEFNDIINENTHK